MNNQPMHKNLGCINMWDKDPQEYIDCRKQNHELRSVNLGRCYNQYYCDSCMITYSVDSSD